MIKKCFYYGFTREVDEKKGRIGRDGQEMFMVNYSSAVSTNSVKREFDVEFLLVNG